MKQLWTFSLNLLPFSWLALSWVTTPKLCIWNIGMVHYATWDTCMEIFFSHIGFFHCLFFCFFFFSILWCPDSYQNNQGLQHLEDQTDTGKIRHRGKIHENRKHGEESPKMSKQRQAGRAAREEAGREAGGSSVGTSSSGVCRELQGDVVPATQKDHSLFTSVLHKRHGVLQSQITATPPTSLPRR